MEKNFLKSQTTYSFTELTENSHLVSVCVKDILSRNLYSEYSKQKKSMSH